MLLLSALLYRRPLWSFAEKGGYILSVSVHLAKVVLTLKRHPPQKTPTQKSQKNSLFMQIIEIQHKKMSQFFKKKNYDIPIR